MLEGKARTVCMYTDLVQVAPIFPQPPNYCLALLRQSVFLHLLSSCTKDGPHKDLVSLCHSEGLICLMQLTERIDAVVNYTPIHVKNRVQTYQFYEINSN